MLNVKSKVVGELTSLNKFTYFLIYYIFGDICMLNGFIFIFIQIIPNSNTVLILHGILIVAIYDVP